MTPTLSPVSTRPATAVPRGADKGGQGFNELMNNDSPRKGVRGTGEELPRLLSRMDQGSALAGWAALSADVGDVEDLNGSAETPELDTDDDQSSISVLAGLLTGTGEIQPRHGRDVPDGEKKTDLEQSLAVPTSQSAVTPEAIDVTDEEQAASPSVDSAQVTEVPPAAPPPPVNRKVDAALPSDATAAAKTPVDTAPEASGKSASAAHAAPGPALSGPATYGRQGASPEGRSSDDPRQNRSAAPTETTKPIPGVVVLAQQTVTVPVQSNTGAIAAAIIELAEQVPQRSEAPTELPRTPDTVRSLKLQLHPAELGVVVAHLRSSSDGLAVELRVETADAARQLSLDTETIGKSLRAMGLEVQTITVQQATPEQRADFAATPQRDQSGAGSSSGGSDARHQAPPNRNGGEHQADTPHAQSANAGSVDGSRYI